MARPVTKRVKSDSLPDIHPRVSVDEIGVDVPTVNDATLHVDNNNSVTSINEDGESQSDGDNGDGNDDIVSVTESLLEDLLDDAEDTPYVSLDGTDGVTKEEIKQLKAQLRTVGPQTFLEQTVISGNYTFQRLATAFGIRPDLPFGDAFYATALSHVVGREYARRQKLPQYNTVDDAVSLLTSSKRIVVITGAGISTSLGIPDFRSKNTGFYSQLRAKGFTEPEEVFDIHLFDEDPSIFYSLAKDVLPLTDRCSPTHSFIKLLQDQDRLLTNYTQNIDNIEQIAGIQPEKLIQCHGSWATAVCRKCKHTTDGQSIFPSVLAQQVPHCPLCTNTIAQEAKSKKRKRPQKTDNWNDDDEADEDVAQPGVMKPGITFFHEQLPNKFFDRLVEHDKDIVDLVIVIGTSMHVSPVNQIPNLIPSSVPHIYISREPVRHINFDIQLLGYCDVVVEELCHRAGWSIPHVDVDKGTDGMKHVIVEEVQGSDHLWSIRETSEITETDVVNGDNRERVEA